MLRYHEVEERRSQRYHANLSRPLDATRVSRWSEALSPPEVAFVEEATRPLMQRWGYEATADGVAAPPELLGDLRELRRRHAAARRRLEWRDRIQKLATHRRPLAAEVPALATSAAGATPAVPAKKR
jgi:hypothetical protein